MHGVKVKNVVFDFGSEVNIISIQMWKEMGCFQIVNFRVIIWMDDHPTLLKGILVNMTLSCSSLKTSKNSKFLKLPNKINNYKVLLGIP